MFRHVGPMAALLILLASGNAEAAEPAKLRIGWAVIPGQLTALVFAKPDLLAHDGTSCTADRSLVDEAVRRDR